MAVTVAQFREYVSTDEDSTFVDNCLAAGKALVSRYIGAVTTVPTHIEDEAVLIASSELFYRRQSPQGVTQFASMDGSPVRAAKDPMNACYPLLAPWVGYAV
jgi:hypothetical protein